MAMKKETQDLQSALSHICKSGDLSPQIVKASGARGDRVSTYRRLVRNGISSCLDNAFPIAKNFLMGEAQGNTTRWDMLVDRFIAEHSASSPYLWRMPLEFAEFVKAQGFADSWNYAFLDDLLAFEWVEIQVHMMPDWVDFDGQPLALSGPGLIIINKESAIQHYSYPVFKVAPQSLLLDSRFQEPSDYFLVVFREPKKLSVRFMELSLFYVRMLELLLDEPMACQTVLERVSGECGISLLPEHVNKTEQLLSTMQREGLLLGYLKRASLN